MLYNFKIRIFILDKKLKGKSSKHSKNKLKGGKCMSILWSIIIGLIVGALAKLVMPGKDPGGIIITILLGIGGSLLFTFLGRMIGWYDEGESAGFIASFLGAIVLLWIYRLIAKRRTTV